MNVEMTDENVMTGKTYDPKCYDLAGLFLGDCPHLHTTDRIEALAAHIQQQIEDWIGDADRNYEPPEPAGFEGGFARNH